MGRFLLPVSAHLQLECILLTPAADVKLEMLAGCIHLMIVTPRRDRVVGMNRVHVFLKLLQS